MKQYNKLVRNVIINNNEVLLTLEISRIEELAKQKVLKLGSFDKKIYLESVID